MQMPRSLRTIAAVLSYCFFTIFLLDSCKKTNAPAPPPAPLPPVKSLIITYPNGQTASVAFRQLRYSFASDTIAHSFSILIVDSTSINNSNAYTLFTTVKTYYFSPDQPRRIIKISFRQGQAMGTATPAPYLNYDILFDYDDYTYDPNHITTVNYQDLAGTQITDQYTYAVGKTASDFYETGSILDIISARYNQATRMPLKTFDWLGENAYYNYESFSDSSFEATENDQNYASVLFNFPQFTDPNTVFRYEYLFDAGNTQCRTFAIDVISPDLASIYGQRKLDFSFDGTSDDLSAIFSLLCVPPSLYWEKVAQQNTRLTLYNQGDYEYTDPYMPDLYAYQADICSSYTDSVFTANNLGTRALVTANRYTNKLTRDAKGNISSLTKYDASNLIVRNIIVSY